MTDDAKQRELWSKILRALLMAVSAVREYLGQPEKPAPAQTKAE